MSYIEFSGVTKQYKMGEVEINALCGVDFSVEKGEFVIIAGESGAGKSTLLNLLGGLDSPTSGAIEVEGKDISKLSGDELAEYRASTIGFVFQFYNLIPTLTVYENVALVKELTKNALDPAEMIAAVGLSGCENRLAGELSGGMKRRVALGGALLAEGGAVLLDEPFKGLDESTKRQAVEFSREMLRGRTAVLVTHDLTEAEALADEVIEL